MNKDSKRFAMPNIFSGLVVLALFVIVFVGGSHLLWHIVKLIGESYL